MANFDIIISYIYSIISLSVAILMLYVTVRYVRKNKKNRNFYTIFTFTALVTTMFFRGFTLIPIIFKGSKLHKHEDVCLEAVFNGTPMMLFMVAVVTNTARWYQVGRSAVTMHPDQNYSKESIVLYFYISKAITFIVILIISYLLVLIVLGYWFFCITKVSDTNKIRYFQTAAISFFTVHVILIWLNATLIAIFKYKLKRTWPVFYKKMKYKLFSFLWFIILLLLVRLAVFSVYFYFSKDYNVLIHKIEEIIALWSTEILPSVLMILSFVMFTGNHSQSIENTYIESSYEIMSTSKSAKQKSYVTEYDVKEPLISKSSKDEISKGFETHHGFMVSLNLVFNYQRSIWSKLHLIQMMIQSHYSVRNWCLAFKFSSSILLYRLLIENFYIAKYLFITLLGGTKNNLVNLGKRLQTVDLSKGKAFAIFYKIRNGSIRSVKIHKRGDINFIQHWKSACQQPLQCPAPDGKRNRHWRR